MEHQNQTEPTDKQQLLDERKNSNIVIITEEDKSQLKGIIYSQAFDAQAVRQKAQEYFSRKQYIETGVLYRNLVKLLINQIQTVGEKDPQFQRLKDQLYDTYAEAIKLYKTLGHDQVAAQLSEKAQNLLDNNSSILLKSHLVDNTADTFLLINQANSFKTPSKFLSGNTQEQINNLEVDMPNDSISKITNELNFEELVMKKGSVDSNNSINFSDFEQSPVKQNQYQQIITKLSDNSNSPQKVVKLNTERNINQKDQQQINQQRRSSLDPNLLVQDNTQFAQMMDELKNARTEGEIDELISQI